jgi:hypothetical protein
MYDDDNIPADRFEQLERTEQAIARIREALVAIAAVHGPSPETDPAAAIVWRLVAGTTTPNGAIREIHELIRSGAALMEEATQCAPTA